MKNSEFIFRSGKRYNDFSSHFRNLFEGRVQKISLHAGFTCPNRDGRRGSGGCTYCNNKTFTPSYCDMRNVLNTQIREGIEFFAKKYEAMRFLAYFQAYSNTYAPVEVLRQLYEEALAHPQIIGLVIATRPDCLEEDVLDLIEELSKKCYIMVELGLESVKNETLNRINRGHSWEESLRAIKETSRRGIHNCAHLILGLPGENYHDYIHQAHTISELPIENLKLHQLQIHSGTRMAREYAEFPERYSLFSLDDYIELVVDYLENLNPSIIIERFVSFAPGKMVIAPKWGLKNFEFVAKVEKRLIERNTWQGKYFKKNG